MERHPQSNDSQTKNTDIYHTSYQEALPSSSIAFPKYAPEISENDDRLIALSKTLHQTISNNLAIHRTDLGKCLEIEGKIGQVLFYDLSQTHPQVQALMNDVKNKPYWHVLMAPRVGPTSYYKFEPKIAGEASKEISDYELFTLLHHAMTEISKENHELKVSREVTKDETIKIGYGGQQVRATYFQTKNGYEAQPREIISKNRLADINIKNGTETSHFRNDFRISTSSEEKKPHTFVIPQGTIVESTRLKERTKFAYKWMVFDLTQTKTLDREGKIKDTNFEVEVEISDLNYLIQQMGNFIAFTKVVQRFIQNIASVQQMIYAIKANSHGHKQKMIAKAEFKLQEQEREAQRQYQILNGADAPQSFVGDYLQNVALKKATNI